MNEQQIYAEGASVMRRMMELLEDHEADSINRERDRLRAVFTEYLAGMGIDVSVAHYTGDSSYPTEYMIRYNYIAATGPTFELALRDFIEYLIRSLPLLPPAKTGKKQNRK